MSGVDESQLVPVGAGLHRPECVLAAPDGDLFASDARGGVTRIRPDGSTALITGSCADLSEPLSPNGIAFDADGAFLVAHFGAEEGGVLRLTRDGQVTPVLLEVDGARLPAVNYVTRDGQGRLWATVSTRIVPRTGDYRPDASSGFLVLDDGRGARIVADGLGYTNECAVTADGATLYVNETFARRVSRFAIHGGGTLGPRETVTELGRGAFPDGVTLDAAGGLWVTCVVGDRVLRVDPSSGTVGTALDCGSDAHVDAAERAYRDGILGTEHLRDESSILGGCSSITFAGGRALLGSLFNDHLLAFTTLG